MKPSTRQRQEAQARLERREIEHALHVDGQVEEHREHPRREPEGDGGDTVEGGLAEEREVEHRVLGAQLDRDESRQSSTAAPIRQARISGAAPALGVAPDQAEDQQEEGEREGDEARASRSVRGLWRRR